MTRESTTFFIPRISLRSPAFFGPVALATLLVLASTFTAPFDEDFSLIRISDPTFVGTVGIWGVCSEYHTENATTANPEATLTGNATYDAMLHNQGKHQGCSPAALGWTFSLPVNRTGLAGMPLPDSGNIGANIDPATANTGDVTWIQVMSKSQSMFLIVHTIAGVLMSLGMLLLLIPYKPLENSLPSLARFLKSCSASLFLVTLGSIMCLISFAVTLTTAIKVRNDINQIGGGGGLHASLGNIMWFGICGAVLSIPSIWSTRGQMGDK